MDITETSFLDEEVKYSIPEYFIPFTMVVYGLFSVSGTIANLFVIITVAVTKRLHTVTNVFIAQLAVGDLIILIFCMPFTVSSAYFFKNWIFGHEICFMVKMAGSAGPTITVLTLAIMSYDRYVGITKPFQAKDTWPRWKAVLVLGSVYLVAFVRSLIRPIYGEAYRTVEKNGTNYTVCAEIPGTRFIFWYHLSGVVVFYFAILVAAGLLYFQIAKKLNSDDAKAMMANNPDAMKKRNKVTKMVFIIVFIIGATWLPINMLALMHVSPIMIEWSGKPWFVILVFVARALEYGNCVANPFLYSFLSTNFISASRDTWSKCFPCVTPATSNKYHTDYSRSTASIVTNSEAGSVDAKKT